MSLAESEQMKPPLPRIETAVPRLPRVQLEIAKAIRTLTAPDQDELLQRRLAELAFMRGELDEIKRDLHKAAQECLALVKAELRTYFDVRRISEEIDKAGFRSDQPRWRRGSGRISGRWRGGAGSLITDQAYRRLRGGHHYVPKEIFENLFKKNKLRPETRKVFDDAVTGPLPKGLHKNDKPHREYTEAVDGLWHQFLERHGIRSEDMTPDQASKFLYEVLHSDDPRISLYNGRFRR
jgi:hypothetical protein